MNMKYSGLQKAITTAGGLAQAAAKLHVNQSVLRKWLKDDGVDVPDDAPNNPAITEAIAKAGSVMALAAELGVTHQCIGIYRRQGYMPAGRAQQVELRYGVERARLVSPKLRNAMGVGGDL